ncbi:hypothetical protein JCM5353_008108 [Sporobolomyces roseus]
MDELQRTILLKISHLPREANPFEVIDDYILDTISPRRPKAFEIQLIICMVAHGLCGILVLGSLIVRISRGSFWLVHFDLKHRSLWTPHFTAGWSVWAIILVVFLEVAVYNAIAVGRSIRPSFAYWWTFAWIPAWMGGFTAAWAISVSLLLHLHASGRVNIIEKAAIPVNTLAIVLPIAYLAVIVPLALTCSKHYESAMREIQTIRQILHSAAAAYDGTFSLLDLGPAFSTVEKLQREYLGFEKWLRITFAFYAIAAFTLVLLLAIVAILYVKILRTALNQAGDGIILRENGAVQRTVMEKTYSNLVITLFCFTTMGSIFSGLSLYIAINPRALVSSSAAEAVALIAFYSFALFGLPTSFLLFIRSFDRHGSSPSPPPPLSSGPKRARSHSHLPSLSLPFRRRSPSNTSQTQLKSLPKGFDLTVPHSSSKAEKSVNISFDSLPVQHEYEKDQIELSNRPFSQFASPRNSFSSTTNALHDSCSTRPTLSEWTNSTRDSKSVFTLSPRKGEFEIDEVEEEDGTCRVLDRGSYLNTLGTSVETNPSPPFVFAATSPM